MSYTYGKTEQMVARSCGRQGLSSNLMVLIDLASASKEPGHTGH